MGKRILALLVAVCLLMPLGQPAMALENKTGAAEGTSEVCCGTTPEFMEEMSASLFAGKTEELQGRMKKSRSSMIGGTFSGEGEGGHMPSTGNVKMLVVPVSFPDSVEQTGGSDYDAELVEKAFFASYASGPINTPNKDYYSDYYSLRAAYYWLSYGKLDITGTVLPVYEAPESMLYYEEEGSGLSILLHSAIQNAIDSGTVNLSDYDSNGDGYVDAIALVPIGVISHSEGNLNAWWPHAQGTSFSSLGPYIGSDMKTSQMIVVPIGSIIYARDPHARTLIHETGHILGLPDNYEAHEWADYNTIYGINELMVSGTQLNAYYKWLLGWIEPKIITNENGLEGNLELFATESFPGNENSEMRAVVLIPYPELLPFDEFYLIEYRNQTLPYVAEPVSSVAEEVGVVIWHCNMILSSSKQPQYRTNYLKPVRKTGSSEDVIYSKDDYYKVGDIFSSDSTPVNSSFYGGQYTGAYLEVQDITPDKAVLKIGFREPDLSPAPAVKITPVRDAVSTAMRDPSSGAVRSFEVRYTAGIGGEIIPWEELEFPDDTNAAKFIINYQDSLKSYAHSVTRSNPQILSLYISKEQNETIQMSLPAGYVRWKGKASSRIVSTPLYVDNAPPALTLKGDDPQILMVGDAYSEAGAEVTDNLDPDIIAGNLEGKLTINTSSLNTEKAGTYTVTYTATDHAGNTATATRTVVVKDPEVPTLISPPMGISGLVYNGESQVLVKPGKAIGGVFEYSLGENADYAETLPSSVNAGEYTVWYRIKSNVTGKTTEPVSFQASIAKMARPKELPGDISVPAGTKLSSLRLPRGWSWKDPAQELAVGENKVPAVYEDTRNYELTEVEVEVTVVEPEHIHTLVKTAAKSATCTAEGNLEYWTCSDCGCIFSDEKGTTATTLEERTLDIVPHTPGEAPTCTTPQRCAVCRTILVKANGHTPGAAATCNTGQRCTVCRMEIKSALGHSYSSEVTLPTCTEQGYTARTCTRCGESYQDTVVKALGHDFGEWTQTKAPTVTEKGEERRDCSRCDAFEVRELPMHVHTEVKIPAVSPTCTQTGLTEGIRCSVCNTLLKKQETVPAMGHNWSGWVTSKAPGCTEKGEEMRGCSRCTETETRELDAKGHQYIATVTNPTCTAEGYTYYFCTVCWDQKQDDFTDPLGHSYGEWQETKAPTCTEKGEEARSCSRCTERETRELAAGHTPGAEATCTEAQKCTVCGTIIEEAKGHTPGEWQIVTPATESQEGLKQKECTVCHTVLETEAIPKLTPAPPSPPSPSNPDPDPEPDPDPVPDPVDLPFTDVREGAWYYDAVCWAYGKELMSGTSDTTFSPNMTTTRGMIVTILWRLAEKPLSTASMTFTDVKAGSYYYEAVRWAAEKGIVNGKSAERFAPDDLITRQELAAILWRYAKLEGKDDIQNGTEILRFADTGEVADWAKEAMTWTVDKGIITGKENNSLDPKGKSTRAQAATMLMRYCRE